MMYINKQNNQQEEKPQGVIMALVQGYCSKRGFDYRSLFAQAYPHSSAESLRLSDFALARKDEHWLYLEGILGDLQHEKYYPLRRVLVQYIKRMEALNDKIYEKSWQRLRRNE